MRLFQVRRTPILIDPVTQPRDIKVSEDVFSCVVSSMPRAEENDPKRVVSIMPRTGGGPEFLVPLCPGGLDAENNFWEEAVQRNYRKWIRVIGRHWGLHQRKYTKRVVHQEIAAKVMETTQLEKAVGGICRMFIVRLALTFFVTMHNFQKLIHEEITNIIHHVR